MKGIYFLLLIMISFMLACTTNWSRVVAAASRDNLARFHYSRGNYKEAEHLLLQALEIRKTLIPVGMHPDYVYTLGDLAYFYYCMGDYSKAEPLLLQALEIEKLIPPEGNHPVYTSTLVNLADLYNSMGNYVKSESLLIEAAEIEKSLPPESKNSDYAVILNRLAKIYALRGNINKAVTTLFDALEIQKNLFPKGRDPGYVETLSDLAFLYESMKDFNKAESLLIQVLGIRKTKPPAKKHYSYSITLNNLALLYYNIGNYSKAEPLYLEALKILKALPPKGKHPDYSIVLSNLALLYESKGIYNKAESLYIESLTIFRDSLQSNFVNLSENEKEKFIDTIFPHFQHFYSFLDKGLSANPNLTGTVTNFRLFQKAIIFRSVKRIRECIRQNRNQELNDDFNTWLILRQQINRAYELTEEQRINQFINLKAWEEKANLLEKKLASRSEDFRSAYEQKEYTWQGVRSTLKPGEAAVELVRYRLFEKKWTDIIYYAVIIIRPESEQPQILLLKNGNVLEEEIVNLYRNFIRETANNPFAQADSNTYHILYTHLWQPITALLEDVKRIYFSPDGIYHFINPCTLQDSGGKWLGERWEFIRITSLQDIMEKKQPGAIPGGPPVLVGCPVFDLDYEKLQLAVKNHMQNLSSPESEAVTFRGTDTLQPLPGSREEVNEIARLFVDKGKTPEVWLGETALEECIKHVDNPYVLHIATHAFFQEDKKEGERLQHIGVEVLHRVDNPLLRSGLLFAGAARIINGKEPFEGFENGILSAREALDLNLYNTELVVLSACDTGLGEVKNGEGVYGLQRAFLLAGADAVLMSLWKVDDKVTRDFMIAFYSAWLSGLSKREAYNEAVVEMKVKYPAPFYWGAFVLVGE